MGIATIEQSWRVLLTDDLDASDHRPFLLGAVIFLGLSLRRWRRVSGAGGQKRYREHYPAHLVSDAHKQSRVIAPVGA